VPAVLSSTPERTCAPGRRPGHTPRAAYSTLVAPGASGAGAPCHASTAVYLCWLCNCKASASPSTDRRPLRPAPRLLRRPSCHCHAIGDSGRPFSCAADRPGRRGRGPRFGGRPVDVAVHGRARSWAAWRESPASCACCPVAGRPDCWPDPSRRVDVVSRHQRMECKSWTWALISFDFFWFVYCYIFIFI